MSLQDIKETIEKHIAEKMLIRIERKNIDATERIEGFPLLLSDRFLLMTVINDLHDEGFAILNIEDITDAYSYESYAFYEKICISEGLRDIECPVSINSLSDHKHIFKCLQGYAGLISVQCEKQTETNAFFLGRIKGVYSDSIEFLDIGMDGEWDNETHIIPYPEISQISFGDNYSKMFYKYCDKLR